MKLNDVKLVLISLLAAFLAQSIALSMTIALDTGELIKAGEQWRFFKGTEPPSSPADDWKETDFNDLPWEEGNSGFGYGDNDDETKLDDMEGNYLTVYIRKWFTAPPLSGDEILELVIDYDDGFVAYLNGDYVEKRHMPDLPVDYLTEAQSHEAGTPVIIPLGTTGDLLNEGNNLLAIEGHNTDVDSSDFSLIPALRTASNDIVRNGDIYIVETVTVALNGMTDAPGAVAVEINGSIADFNSTDGTWEGEVPVVSGLNTIVVEALDAGTSVIDSGSIEIVYVPPGNHISGELTGDTAWSGAYILEDTVTVPDGNVLNIEPGTFVLMEDDVSIIVYGQLLADGNESEPIYFTHYGDGTTWERIMLIETADSRLAHCIIEYSDCEGDHKDYYDDDCNDATVPPSRTYFQAVVALASHIDVNGCIFQKLPDDSANAEGDAIAIISDDPDIPGEASAHIWNSHFIGIGQGVHTRYSYVLVENCFFTGHSGDNDDVDLYGESTPPPLIRNNLFLNPDHDDMINPTRCSAVIIGNVIGGCDDHGVVLRDKSSPVMINNLIFDCTNAGIAVQNQCDALLINNTIYNCDRGIRFFDHTDRRDPPYCLFPGSGKATVVNCIVWNCPTTFELTDSPYEEDRGSHVTIMYSDIEGAQSQMSVSEYSTVTWLNGNINENPQFVNPGSEDFHLKSVAGRWNPDTQSWVNDVVTSPCIDAGNPGCPLGDEPNDTNNVRINMGAYGGTGEASKSPEKWAILADLTNDQIVDFNDLKVFVDYWLDVGECVPSDLNRTTYVDFDDFTLLGNCWMNKN
jgi:hypothetical protein